jgi:hypothetical protein
MLKVICLALTEEDTLIRLPKKTAKELKKLSITPNEPYYHIIGRLIVEHKERV